MSRARRYAFDVLLPSHEASCCLERDLAIVSDSLLTVNAGRDGGGGRRALRVTRAIVPQLCRKRRLHFSAKTRGLSVYRCDIRPCHCVAFVHSPNELDVLRKAERQPAACERVPRGHELAVYRVAA